MVNNLKPQKDSVQSAEDVYDALVIEKQAGIQSKSTMKNSQTCSLGVVFIVLFLIAMVVAIATLKYISDGLIRQQAGTADSVCFST